MGVLGADPCFLEAEVPPSCRSRLVRGARGCAEEGVFAVAAVVVEVG